jgi:hypothetical protein
VKVSPVTGGVDDTNPLGLKFSVVSALKVTGQLEIGTAVPTFENATAGGGIL